MKKGLFWIDERTSQLRYIDSKNEQSWAQPLSSYIPLEKIKRGQPVSVATISDLKEIAGENTELYNALRNSSDTYCVLTNPSKHTSSIGLSLEYTEGQVSISSGELHVPEKIHILGSGQYIEDRDYISNAFDDNSDIEETEYWPSFFNDYESSIGQKVYVKGSAKGELTIDKEEAYRAYNNIIVIGFVANANIKNGENTEQLGVIEVQIEGDDRGALDSTQFEVILGEDISIGRNYTQLNGESNSIATKVLAVGKDDDEKFKFSYIFTQKPTSTMPKGFIGVQRVDGATSFIYTNGKIETDELLKSDRFNTEDRAFVQVSKYYASVTGLSNSEMCLGGDAYTTAEKVTIENAEKISTKLSEAFKAIAANPDVSLKDGKTHQPQKLIKDTSTVAAKYAFEADDVGGTYEVYFSSNLAEFFSDLFIESRGASYNKGYAVLADIRNKNRQVLYGVYNSGMSGLVKKGTRCNVLKNGLFTDKNKPFEPGATYYLGSHGDLYKVPQESYDCVVQIGTAQTEEDFIVDCSDPRHFNSGDFPVGYMKPSVRGFAEFGFWLMDGTTPHKTADAPLLVKCLKDWYNVSELKIQNYNFGDEENPDIQEGFVIPAVNYAKHTGEEGSPYVAAQIKWIQDGVYSESFHRTPFIRKTVDLTGTAGRAEIPDIDITALMTYGPEEDRVQVPALESLDIKLFVDANNDENNRNWVQIDPGFHIFDSYKYYGYKWTVVQTKEPAKDYPFGEWALRAVYSAKENEKTEEEDQNTMGLCLQLDPFAAPLPLTGYRVKVFVAKHDFYDRQFDVENLYKNFVRESVVDPAGIPWSNNAVSGKAVADYISSKIATDKLTLSDLNKGSATVEGYIKSLDIYAPAHQSDYKIPSTWHGDIRLKSSVNPDWSLDWYNGLVSYHSFGTEGIEALKRRVEKDSFALVPYSMHSDHASSVIRFPEGSVKGSGPHGISNSGWSGNLDASWLQGAHLGYPGAIFSQNASDTINSEDVGTKVVTKETITIPYIQKYREEYITRLGNVVRHHDGQRFLDRETFSFNNDTSSVNDVTKLVNGAYSYNKTYESAAGKKVTEKISLNGNGIEFLDERNSYVPLKASAFNIASSIKYKYVLSRYEGSNTPDAISENYSDKIVVDDSLPQLNEALQAIYEMPLATYKTNAEYESNDSYFKRYFGIVVEQVAATREKFKNSETSGTTSLDDLKFVYTDREAKSVAEYLNLMTDNKEAGFSVQNAVGILLKAAKETQARLLNLEVSTYGKDSPTLPGNDVGNDDFIVDQKSTVAGLNRLVKALCREVFQDSNPSNIDTKGAWSGSSSSYSRLDMIDREVNGEVAVNENGKRIALKATSTYPEDASVTQIVTVEKSPVLGSDEDFSSPDFISSASYTAVSSSGSFDGVNDAVNRIAQKLNTLTKDIIGEDNIKSRPKMLDYIRQTLDTLVKDIYIENEDIDKSLENEAYKKTALSRIDKIVQDLYKFELSLGEFKTKDRLVNNKSLSGSSVPDVNSNYDTSFVSKVPSTLEAFDNNATVIDLIIDQICGEQASLLRNKSSESFSDAGATSAGYKDAAAYKPAEFIASNARYFNKKTMIARLDALEKAVQILTLKLDNSLDFESLVPLAKVSQYDNISSVTDFMNSITGLLGLSFDKTGFKAERNSTIKAESIKNGSLAAPIDSLDLYNILYDTVARMKNIEASSLMSTAALGSDYDNYSKSKSDFESLDPNSIGTQYSNDYTVSSDMKAVLKLLYGKDNGTNTDYAHFSETNSQFYSSPSNGVSALETLYKHLFTLPATNGVTIDRVTSSTVFNPSSPKSISPDITLGNGNRSRYAGFQAPSRIDVLEKEVKALYNYLDLGLWTNSDFQNGNFKWTENAASKVVSVNGAETSAKNAYSVFDTQNSTYRLTDFVLQAYFNTVANNSTLSNVTKQLNDVSSALSGKQSTLTAGSNITISGSTISAKDTTYSVVSPSLGSNVTGLVTADMAAKWNNKQDVMTIDDTVIANSSNPVTSGAVSESVNELKTAVNSKVTKSTTFTPGRIVAIDSNGAVESTNITTNTLNSLNTVSLGEIVIKIGGDQFRGISQSTFVTPNDLGNQVESILSQKNYITATAADSSYIKSSERSSFMQNSDTIFSFNKRNVTKGATLSIEGGSNSVYAVTTSSNNGNNLTTTIYTTRTQLNFSNDKKSITVTASSGSGIAISAVILTAVGVISDASKNTYTPHSRSVYLTKNTFSRLDFSTLINVGSNPAAYAMIKVEAVCSDGVVLPGRMVKYDSSDETFTETLK